jgi:prevent-host-death family protein
MIKVGAFEAKTHLSALLDKVSHGEEVLITKHGKPVARLVSAVDIDQDKAGEAIRKIRENRKGLSLGDTDWKELRDFGRR